MALDQKLIDFYLYNGPNNSGASLAEILGWQNPQLENTHDWVQWCFPLDTESLAVPGSPVANPETITFLLSEPDFMANYYAALNRYIVFLDTFNVWLTYSDHNHKRISRVLRSLKLFGRNNAQRVFYDFVMRKVAEANNPISTFNTAYWEKELA